MHREALDAFLQMGVTTCRADAAVLPIDFYEAWTAFFADRRKVGWSNSTDGIEGYHAFRSERAMGAQEADAKEFLQLTRSTTLPEPLGMTTSALFSALETTAQGILAEIAAALEMPHCADLLSDTSRMIMRITHYPPGTPSPGAAAASHTDIDLVTLLPPATGRGLYVEDRAVGWREAEAAPGEVLILAGDMLETATAGRVRAVRHRVDPGPLARLSVSFFANPADDRLLDGRVTAGQLFHERVLAMTI